MTILSSNFFFKNTDFDDFQALLDEENPDLFIIHEAGPQWLPKMNSFKTTYSYIGSTKKLGIHGIIIGSRIPGTFKEITLGTKVGLEFTPENGSYHVLGVHPFAPITSADAKERNQQFEDIATYVHLSKVPVIVMGDFNCTPWSPYFKDLLKKADLHDARFGFGLLPTWHAHNFFFKLPIDHALLHGPWEVFDFYGARALTGSDHLPIVVKLSL